LYKEKKLEIYWEQHEQAKKEKVVIYSDLKKRSTVNQMAKGGGG